jgi:hypothetical protein
MDATAASKTVSTSTERPDSAEHRATNEVNAGSSIE